MKRKMQTPDMIDGIEILSSAELRAYGPSGLGKTANKQSIYERISEAIIKKIDSSEELFWRKPFGGVNADGEFILPRNYGTKKPYRGFNMFSLYLVKDEAGYSSSEFLTYKQAEAMGGQVRKGEEGSPVIFYTKSLYRHNVTKKTISAAAWERLPASLQDQYESSWTLRAFTVFNMDQIDGIEYTPDAPVVLNDFEQIEACEAVIENMPNKPPIIHKGLSEAYYTPAYDKVTMPVKKAFDKPQFYYSVLYHELVHATGSENRLNREEKKKRKAWGDSFYAYEELIAEMGAAYLCGCTGIEYHTLDNSAAYIKSWKSQVKNYLAQDPQFFTTVCGFAQKAADYMLYDLDESVYKKFPGYVPRKVVGPDMELEAKAQAQKIKILLLTSKL